MASSRFPIPQGTLDLLILRILSLEPAHGYAIARRLQQLSREVVHVNQGSVYPAPAPKRWLKSEGPVSGPDFLDWQAQNDGFEKMAVSYGSDESAVVVGGRAVLPAISTSRPISLRSLDRAHLRDAC